MKVPLSHEQIEWLFKINEKHSKRIVREINLKLAKINVFVFMDAFQAYVARFDFR